MLFFLCPFLLVFSSTLQAQNDSVNADLGKHEKAKNSYLNSSIHSITTKKDSLLKVYGTFEAARKAGALVRQPITIKKTSTPNKK